MEQATRVGITIVGIDTQELIKTLNRVYADEWIAYYQYWLCAKLVEGPMRVEVAAELEEHAREEHKHATLLADRIIQLGGTPLLKPADWHTHAGCGYDATRNAYVQAVLEENLKGEQCAIQTYHRLLAMVDGKDPITYDIILSILADEVEHEHDLVRLLTSLRKIQTT
ncbi:ferritin [bacterium]|nr:ferritin [bacterium]